MKKYIIVLAAVVASQAYSMESPRMVACEMDPQMIACAGETMAKVRNESMYDVQDLVLKVKINGKKGKVRVPALGSGQEMMVDLTQAVDKKGNQLVADPNTIESLEILKIRPKSCLNLQTGSKAKCRGRLKPEDKMQREFIITDEKAGVVKISRKERGKGKPQFEQPEPRLVRVR